MNITRYAGCYLLLLFLAIFSQNIRAEEAVNFPVQALQCKPMYPGADGWAFWDNVWQTNFHDPGVYRLECPLSIARNVDDEYDVELDYTFRSISFRISESSACGADCNNYFTARIRGVPFFGPGGTDTYQIINLDSRYMSRQSTPSGYVIYTANLGEDGLPYIKLRKNYYYFVEIKFNTSDLFSYRFHAIWFKQGRYFAPLPIDPTTTPIITDPIGPFNPG